MQLGEDSCPPCRAEKNIIMVVQVRERHANSDESPLLLTSHNFLREDGRTAGQPASPFAYRLQRLLMPLSSCLAREASLLSFMPGGKQSCEGSMEV